VCVSLLKVALFRYVDDYFGVDDADEAQHALDCIVRVIHAIMGRGAIAPSKSLVGSPLTVLGVQITIGTVSISVTLDLDKAQKWTSQINYYLDEAACMPAAEAATLAGRLSFAAQHIFRRAGRALLRPLFAQQHAPLEGNRVGPNLRVALNWWSRILSLGISEAWPVNISDRPPVADVFVDARGWPPRAAAVIHVEGRIAYTSFMPSDEILASFLDRADSQIMGLELLSAALGLSTFAELIEHRTARLWIDNRGGECALLRGSAASSGHNCLVHNIWGFALEHGFGLWVERVVSRETIADEPSRELYSTLDEMGAVWMEPSLQRDFVRW